MKTILAIDDQKDNLISIDAVVKSRIKDVRIVTANSGKEGIEIARKEKPDCIVLDIIMPGMDGYETCKHLKSSEETAYIPIIMLTAIKTDSVSKVRGLELGADAFLSKPIEPEELIAQIKVMFRIKSAEDKLRSEKINLEKKVEKQTEDIVASRTKLNALFENSPIPYFSLSKEGKIISINNAWLKHTGYSSENVIEKKFTNLLQFEEQSKFTKAFNDLIKKGSISDHRTKLINKENREIDINLFGSAEYDIKNNYRESYWIYQDISDHIETKIAKAESDRKFKTLVDNLNGIAYQCYNDEYYTMTYLSKGFEQIFGYNTDDIINNSKTPFIEIIHPEDREYVLKEINGQLSESSRFNLQYRIIVKNGDVHHVIDKGMKIQSPISTKEKLEGLIYDITDSIRTGDEINKLISVITQNPSIIVISDTNGMIEYVNPKFCEVSGFSSDEVIGENVKMLRSEESTITNSGLWDTISSGELWRGEFQNKNKDGSLFNERALIFPVKNYEGKITNFIKLAEDITEVKKSKAALYETESRYKKLLNTTSEGFWVIDENNITVEVNQALCDMLECNEEDIIGYSPFKFTDDENRKILQSQIKLRETNDNRKYDISLTTFNGKNIPVRLNASSIKNSDGRFIGSFALISDMRDLKRSENIQKLLYSISHTVTTTENLNDLIENIRVELGKIIDTTNFYIALYDKEKNELSLPFFSDQKDDIVSIPIGKSLSDYVIKTKKPLLADNKVKEDLERQGYIKRFGSSSKIWLGVPLFLEGEVIGVIVVQSYEDEKAFTVDDMEILEFVSNQIAISIDKKSREEKVYSALEKATESDRLKTAFLQNISHEIRTPMNGILGFTSLLKESTLPNEEHYNYLDVIMISSNRMLNTLKDIMDMAMLETGQVKFSFKDLLLANEFTSQYNTFKLESSSKKLDFKLVIPENGNDIVVNTDKDKLQAILSNLLKNAIKFTMKGSVTFGFEIKSDQILVFVKDTGIGIPGNRLDAIFDKFVQADIDDVKVHEGTGIGLTIAKSYVEMLGGKIWVESVVNKGTDFYFSLPYDNKENTDIALGAKKGQKPVKQKLKILIVEDELFTIEFFKIILEVNNNELLFAGDGIEAVELTRKNPDLDLILMDIKLPKMDGYAATASIRTFNEKVVIVAQTAYALAGDNQKALEAGCNEYLSKPIKQEKLFAIINKYFS